MQLMERAVATSRLQVRRITSLILVITTAATGVVVSSSSGAGASGQVTTLTVPQVPTQQPTLKMACGPNQIDLNHASLDQLRRLPGVSLPIAQRIVAQRPHDRVQDLLVVSGIGPEKLVEIDASKLACSTPLTLPPPAGNPCTSQNQIDVNNPGSIEALTVLFGGPTAARLVSAQPYPDLAHATVVLAAGAGPGKVQKIASQLCLTPEPKTFAGVNYSFVYAGTGGRADYQGFNLTVPAGVLNSDTGQWITIAPMTTPTPDLPGRSWPSADFAILGTPWQAGGERVYVTLPIDPMLAEVGAEYEPVIAHWSDVNRQAGEEVAGDQLLVNAAAGTVTAAVTHLSLIDSINRKAQWVTEPLLNIAADARFPAPTCDGTWTVNGQTGDWSDANGGRVHLESAYLNLPGTPVPLLGFALKHCVEGGDGSTSTLRLLNNTRTMMSLTAHNGTTPQLGDVNLTGDLMPLAIAKAAEVLLGHPVAYPGGEVTATVPSGSFNAVRMAPNVWLTGLWAILDQSPFEDLAKKLPHVTAVYNAINAAAKCVMSATGVGRINNSTSPQTDADAIKGYVKDCFTPDEFWQIVATAVKSGVVSADLANQVSSILNEISRYSMWLRVGQVATTGVDYLLNASGDSAGIIGIEFFAAKPTQDAQGRTVLPECLSAHGYGWTVSAVCQDAIYYAATHPPAGSGGGTTGLPPGYILRNPTTGAATFYNSDAKTSQSIDDGGTYLCLAQRYVVDWAPNWPSYTGSIIVSPSASCENSWPGIRALDQGKLAPNVILRESDGTAWAIVTLDGIQERVHITTQSDFMCWVSPPPGVIKFYVWDQVTSGELSHFPVAPDGTYVSNCLGY